MTEKRRKKKIPTRFSRKMQKKLLIVFSLISVALIGLIGRLMYIEYTSGAKYEKIVLSQQEYDSSTIPYRRGDIVDTKGTILATSTDVYNVILDCKVLNNDEKKIEPTITALVQCFPDLNADELRQLIQNEPNKQYNVLEKRLPYDQIQGFVTLQEDKKNNPDIDGVWFEKEYIRKYPYGSIGSSVIGFTTSGNVGMAGIENSYNSTLNGINGREYGYLNSDNNFEKTIKAAEDGNVVVSTIDLNIQSIVEEKVAQFQIDNANVAREGAGSKHTAVVVMNPQNGEVLAMAQYPNYDSSNPRDLSAYYTQEQIDAMSDDEKLDALNGLWQNYCLTETYEPGSTAKPFTVAAGLETGTLSGDETYLCDGSELVSGSTIHCVNRNGHGLEGIREALMNSCNDALMQMSYAIGVDNFVEYQKIFGFGQKTNIDLPGEARTDSLIYTRDSMTAVDLATNSFGQNFNTTMIQMSGAFCSLINGGYYYQPHVVKKITDEDGNTIQTMDNTLIKQTVSEATSEKIKGYLYSTVSEGGTGKYAKVNGYSMGGKTGTAQKIPRGQGNYLVSFIGYAPQEKPQLMVYVIVDEPNAEDEAHSSYAQGIAQEIFAETLPYLNIYPDEPMAAEMPVNPTLPEAKQQAIEAANAAASGQQADAAVPDQTQAEEGTTDTPSSDIAEQGAATTGPAVTNDVDVVTSE
ncbi:MAG: penicillin-binding protein 2 [Lachnospiraceae bacterium]|nr:penicillin-binding protein 2 [Lachnospiraceae bacterium]